MKRIERKKKKLAALIEITELNNKDRIEGCYDKRTNLLYFDTVYYTGFIMQPSTKKMKRIERKKKKLAALIEITELNNKDRIELESPQPYGPNGDHTVIMEIADPVHIEKKKKVEELSQSYHHSPDVGNLSEPREAHDTFITRGDSIGPEGYYNVSPRKSKKKRKSKHQEDGETRRKHKSKSGGRLEAENRDEWPMLAPNSQTEGFSHKRKSSFEMEIQKERPMKMVKRHTDDYYELSANKSTDNVKTFSFTDELESFKKEVERSKKKKEKKQEESTDRKISNNKPDLIELEIGQSNDQDEEELSHNTEDEDELTALKKLLRERKKQLKEVPMVRLKGVGKDADLALLSQRTPVLPCDVQSFLLLSQLGHDCPRYPRWVELKKFNRLCKTVVLVVEGVSAYDLYSQESSCPTLQQVDVKAEMVSPYCYNSSIIEELCAVAITRQQKKDLERKFGKEICPEALLTDRIIKVLRSAFSISSVPKTISEEVEQKISVPTTDKFPRTELLLSAWQLIEEGYPLPYGSTELGNRYPDYVMTKDEYAEVTPSSPMWALDCEMCLTREGNELTRVSVVNEQHKTVYESFCLPRNPIKNYLTEYSGITAEMLKGVTTRLEDIQKDLQALFPPDVILVGQSLGGDMHALKMMHPYMIDTSVIFNLTGNRRHKSKLSRLSMEFLNEAIQQRGADGHDSVEDSLAALKLVQHKLTKSIEYGDAVLSGLKEDTNYSTNNILNSSYPEHHANEFEDLKIEVGPTMASSLFKHFAMKKKSVVVIGPEETLAEYSTFVAAAHKENKQLVKTTTTSCNSETIDKTCHECKTNNFTLAHVVLGEEEDIILVDSWMKRIMDSPPFNSLFVVVLAGSHQSFANGACLIKIKKPNLKLKTRKTD